MGDFQWAISNGRFPMGDFQWAISNGGRSVPAIISAACRAAPGTPLTLTAIRRHVIVASSWHLADFNVASTVL
jgi:hypothetical protein